jgi:DNA-binding response OmpR family regulator
MKSPKPRILFTEDDEDTRDLLAIVLNEQGYDIINTPDYWQALALAKQKKFDLYLLDSWMPGLSGFDLCSALRQFDSITPILFYSGAAFESDKKRALECGAQAYLVKPVECDFLISEIKRLIAN